MTVSLVTRGFIGGATSADVASPVITIVSPDPSAPAGDPSGFPQNYAAAKKTYIVLDVTDVTPGIRIVTIVWQQKAGNGRHALEEVVYRKGEFRGGYKLNSFAEEITDGVRLHCRRAEGWPGSDEPEWGFEVDAVDKDGNLS